MNVKLNTFPLVALAIISCHIFVFTNAVAQGGQQGYFNKAEQLHRQQKYVEAAQYYEKYLASERSVTAKADPFAVGKKTGVNNGVNVHQQAVYNLAESYRLSHDYNNAEKYYKEAATFSEEIYPAAVYWYGITLRANQKYAEAIEVLSTYREKHGQMDEAGLATDRELLNLSFIKAQLSQTRPGFFVTPVSSPTNSSAYAQTLRTGDTVVFTAIQKPAATVAASSKGAPADPPARARLFEAIQQDGILQNAGEWNSGTPEGFHDGLATFAGNKMFFTRWTDVNGKSAAALYAAERKEQGWSTPVKLGEPFNMPGSGSTQPFATRDGKYLLFSSDRAGGVGKYDIWFIELDSDANALTAKNMGNVINTVEDEFAPSYHAPGKTVIFSSNGRTGMGGLDIYYSRGSIIMSDWNTPANAGSPINSSKDDLYYISTDEDNLWNTGLMSSDRDTSGCCLAMYSVRQNNKQYINGKVIDCATQKPLPDVTIDIKDTRTGKLVRSEKTDQQGGYAFEMSNISRYTIVAGKKSYDTTSKDYLVRMEAGKETIHNEPLCLNIRLSDYADSLQQVLNNLANTSSTLAQFGYNKSAINGSFAQLDSLVLLMKQYPTMKIEIGGYTDTKGTEEYNLVLAQKRVDACINYLVRKGIGRDRLAGKAYGECCPLEPETIDGKDNPAAREKNRRVEYKLVGADR
ncbi:MAG: OmpA family protein [Chitinophagaceae bacterium]|nr:OmpA family protein [Chitinophagaceae bacterium]